MSDITFIDLTQKPEPVVAEAMAVVTIKQFERLQTIDLCFDSLAAIAARADHLSLFTIRHYLIFFVVRSVIFVKR